MHNHVFVVDANREPLSPCHPAKARKLLGAGRAAVLRRYPFTIILKDPVEDTDPVPCEVKVDPGSRTSGIAVVQHNQRGPVVVWAAEIDHKGQQVKEKLTQRCQQRRARRSRKTRYRKPRFDNRRRPPGWLPPSLMSRVGNITTWARRLWMVAPVQAFTVEQVKFDPQLMENPAISGIEYQQGTLYGYNVREYLLERDGRHCAYCGATNVSLEVEHIIPQRRSGGHNRVTNLTLACHDCNQQKGNRTAEEFGYPEIQARIQQRSMRAVAAVNATRTKIVEVLSASGLPVWTGSGAETKFNRAQQGYPKAHWIDAACAGSHGNAVLLDPTMQILRIKATGRQARQMCRVDRFGFPRTSAKGHRYVKGFSTGDIVRAVVPRGRHQGTHVGRVAVRATGSFRVGSVDGINWQHCRNLHHADGYQYAKGASTISSQA